MNYYQERIETSSAIPAKIYIGTLDWGAWESKVKYCVPQDKQSHRLHYFTAAEYSGIEAAVKISMLIFLQDAKEICEKKGISYNHNLAEQVIAYFD